MFDSAPVRRTLLTGRSSNVLIPLIVETSLRSLRRFSQWEGGKPEDKCIVRVFEMLTSAIATGAR